MNDKWQLRAVLTGLYLMSAPMIVNAEAIVSHGLSMFGDLKYSADFEHFDYANPDAPKGGTVRRSSLGSFDSLNPWILKGVSATGIAALYDSLMSSSADEVSSSYGLIAESVEVADDKRWATFSLRKEARWHDGVALTAADVVWTLEIMKTQGHPVYRSYYAGIAKAEALESHKVKFYFTEGNNPELPIIAGSIPILPKHYYAEHEFEKTTMEPPLGSGAYKIKSVDAGRSIEYELVEDYWARDLPVNKGANNFQNLRYDYYRDMTISLEALKAGDVDFREEYISKNWATAYDFPALVEGRVIKEDLANGNIQRMQAQVMNLRKPKYQDIRVRKALSLAYDFEWMNKNLFFGAYKRNSSFFQNSELAATGLPEGGELELLNKYRDQVPESIFTTEFEPPATDGRGNPRRNFRQALALFKAAGWEVQDGKLRNVKTGEPFEIEFITRQPSVEKLALTYKKNLERLGIDMKVRVIDTAQYVRLVEDSEFDFITSVFSMANSPGMEQRGYWSSEAADDPGSNNHAGIKNPVVDALVEEIIKATSRQEQIDATRALDRVLLHNNYVIPAYFGDTYRLAYWNKFSRPEIAPQYSMGFEYWWIDSEKEAALQK